MVTIYLCAVEIGPVFTLVLYVSDCIGHKEYIIPQSEN